MKGRKDWEWYARWRRVEKKKTGKNKELRRIFMGISLSLILTIILGMGLMYRMMEEMIIDQNIRMSMEAFAQVQADFEEAERTANILATQVLLDDVCSAAVNATQEERPDSLTLNRVRKQLSMYHYTNPNVDSIYLYNDRQDLIITSGSRFGAVGKSDFQDASIVSILANPAEYNTDTLIRREMTGKFSNNTEWEKIVYSRVLFAQREGGSAVVVNMTFDNLMQSIQKMDVMKNSRMLIINKDRERLVDLSTCPVEETEELRAVVLDMVENKEQYREADLGHEKYFISWLHASGTQWDYVKVTRWDSIFGVLNDLRGWTVRVVVAIAAVIFGVAMWNSVSVLRIQNNMEKKYRAIVPQTNVFQQKEIFLNNFLHSRKIYRKEQLRGEMKRAGFSVFEEARYTLLLLQIESYDRFMEVYGEKGTYNIKFGFQNIFEEIFSGQFHIVGLINRDDTITFLVEVSGIENFTEKLRECFQSFCGHVGVFVQWDFFCLGTEQQVSLEKIPELNSEVQKSVKEGFFYPSNSYVSYEQIRREHAGRVAFRQLKTEEFQKALKSGQQIQEVYEELARGLEHCGMTEYMHAMLWLGITVIRNIGGILSEDDGNEFLLRLARCGKIREMDALFQEMFTVISNSQGDYEEKMGVAGRLDEVREFVAENYRDPNMTLKALGDEFGVSPNYLGRLFKKDTGQSVAEYINEVRLEQVLKELKETDDSAKDIAERNGFISNNYFYTYFKKKVGVTPQVYREKQAAGAMAYAWKEKE